MRRKPLDHMQCSIAKAADVVGDPWSLLIVRDALLGVTRFEDFQRRLEVPRATLSARLDHLVETGVLVRNSDAGRSGRSGYLLTAKGRALQPVIITLMRWGDEWLRDDEPPTALIERDSGRAIEPVLVDSATGVPLRDLAVRATGPVTEDLTRVRPRQQ